MVRINPGIKIAIAFILGLGVFVGVSFYGGFFKEHKATIEIEKSSENTAIQPSSQEDRSTNEAGPMPESKTADLSQGAAEVAAPKKSENISPEKIIDKGGASFISRLVNFGFEKRDARNIDAIIIHSSYDAIGSNPFSVEGIIKEYEGYGVSPHYLIDRAGTIYQLVEDKNVAYHAGVSQVPDGRSGVNGFSLGIEMMNTKTGKLTDEQYVGLNSLLALLKSKYKIKYVLGHNQISPGRKDDPWNFDWSRIK